MPKKYEAIRDKCIKEGGSTKACKTKAAKIYNATRKPGQKPVTGKMEKPKRKMRVKPRRGPHHGK